MPLPGSKRIPLLAAVVAGLLAGGGVLLFRGHEASEARPIPTPPTVQPVTPPAVPQFPPCKPEAFTLSLRVEPWFGDNLITVEAVNNGPECTDATGLGVVILPAPPGASAISFSGWSMPAGEQPPVQLVWRGGCALAGRLFDIRASLEGVSKTVSNIPARGCVEGKGDSLGPAEKLDVVGGVPLPALPSCRTSQLALGFEQEPAIGSVVVNASITNNAAPCRLRGNLSIEVLDAAGPDAVPVYADLDRALTATAFAWENWCGAPGKFTLRLALGALSVSSVVDPPACGNPQSGSGLRSTQGASALAPIRSGVDFDRLRGDPRKAAEVALSPRWGFTAVILSVTLDSYRDLMCGRQPYVVEDRPVWAVTLLITSQRVSTGPGPTGATPVAAATLPTTMLFIIDAATFDSLQTFTPWPVARAPSSTCP